MPEIRSAVSFDFDGVLFPRIPIQSEALKPQNHNKQLEVKHEPIYRIDRPPQDRPLSWREQMQVLLHSRRSVNPEVAKIVHGIHADIKIGNTGRPNNLSMVTLTLKHLHRVGIENDFEYVNFKPTGVSSEESKYWGLVELRSMGYRDITHFDDNAGTIKRLAPILPEVQFVIVQDLTSGILFSRSEMQKYPNVTRIASLKKL